MKEQMKIQIILAGIGGQGILFTSRIFSELGLRLGINVMGSETHGMSQRGGSVIAHLKLGEFQSPLIRTGAADFLYSLDTFETYRALKFLKTGGICFANGVSSDRLDGEVMDFMRENKMTFVVHDAGCTAAEIGSARAANVALIGYSLGTGLAPFAFDDVRTVLESVSKEAQAALNVKAFNSGYRLGKEFKKQIVG
jgi:indolepyruvate ferredoxin oxidoreductase beta subunit